MPPGPKNVRMTVAGTQDGKRLDKVLAELPAVGSRAAAQRLIVSGLVKVDGEPRGKNYTLSEGQLVQAELPPPPETDLEPEPMDLAIPYEDEHLLVVDKPAGIVTHPAKGHPSGTLVNGLLAHSIAGGDSPRRPGIVHRLDRDTSGLMIVAKSEAAHRRLVEMLAGHEVERTYLALVHGLFSTLEGTVEAPVGRDTSRRKQMSVAAARGRHAVTHFRVARSWPEGAGTGGSGGFSLLEVRLETGRTHQIRVHLAAIGHPVAGDRTYGRRKDVLGVGRQFLHSARLRFEHPVTGEVIELESPLPDDLQVALERLAG